MAIHVNGASVRALSPPRVLVTGGSGFGAGVQVYGGFTGAGIPVEHAAPQPGKMPAVIVDTCAARALGYPPAYDLKSGLSTVWPEFPEAAK
jgi:hypothetical protein